MRLSPGFGWNAEKSLAVAQGTMWLQGRRSQRLAIVDADSESAARQLIGSLFMQSKARITKVETFTEMDIEAVP